MIDLKEVRTGNPIMVENGESLIPVIITVIDPISGDLGIKEAGSNETRRVPAAKAYTHYPRHNNNGHQPAPPMLLPKDRNWFLLRLIAGFIITLAKGKTEPEFIKQVAEAITEHLGIMREARAQEIITALHFYSQKKLSPVCTK